jgi:hypothetical protein
MRDCGCTLERGHDGKCDLTGPLPRDGCQCDHCLADAAGVEPGGEIARLRAALAAAEERADTVAAIDVPMMCDVVTEAMYGGFEIGAEEREACHKLAERVVGGLGVRLAALSSPVQPEETER